jgi:hypothetical protein
MDNTWIAALKRPRGGFASVTIKAFFAHLRTNVAKLSTKEKRDMKKQIEMEWDQNKDLTEYFTAMEQTQLKLETWNITVESEDMVNAAVEQLQDSGIFDRKFLRQWEQRAEHEKTWEEMKAYYLEEYRAIKQFDGPTAKDYEKVNNFQEGIKTSRADIEVQDFFEEFRRDAMVGVEQIQQMSGAFTGASNAMTETMQRLKEAMATITTLNETITTLTATNKKLSNTIANMTSNQDTNDGTGGNRATGREGGRGNMGNQTTSHSNRKSEPNTPVEKCPICKFKHATPFNQHCWELEVNKDKRPDTWVSKLRK